MPVVNPGIRRFLGSAIQRLFNSASFYAPLTHTLALERGTGSPTFTRASTATFTDWEGVLRTVPSGCARFEGARMIYNLIADLNAASRKSNDFTLWTASNATAVGNTVTFGAPAGAGSYIYTGGSLSSGNVAFRTFVASATVSCAAGTEAFQLGINDTGDSTYVSGDFIATTTPQRVSFVKTLGGTNAGVGMLITNSVAGGAKTIIVEDAQLEDVTGQADQTASEYVSVGVLSDPWHGAGVDGVEFFDTDRDGNPIPDATLDGYLSDASVPPDVLAYQTASNIAAAAGWIRFEYTPSGAPSGTVFLWGTYVDANNYTAILHDATNLVFRKRIAGSNYDATIANAFVSGTTYKVAATWGAAGTAIYLDGVAGTPHANTTAAQIAATMQVGADGNSLQQPGAGTTNLRIWQRQLSAPEGVAVTS